MVVPAAGGVDEAGRVCRPDPVGDLELGVVAGDLAPALVIDNPSDDASVTLVLVDHDTELALPLVLLVGVRLAAAKKHAGHVLDDKETKLVTGVVEEIGLDLDLLRLLALRFTKAAELW